MSEMSSPLLSCIEMCKGQSYEEKFAGLVLMQRVLCVVPGSDGCEENNGFDKENLFRCADAVNPSFLKKLIKIPKNNSPGSLVNNAPVFGRQIVGLQIMTFFCSAPSLCRAYTEYLNIVLDCLEAGLASESPDAPALCLRSSECIAGVLAANVALSKLPKVDRLLHILKTITSVPAPPLFAESSSPSLAVSSLSLPLCTIIDLLFRVVRDTRSAADLSVPSPEEKGNGKEANAPNETVSVDAIGCVLSSAFLATRGKEKFQLLKLLTLVMDDGQGHGAPSVGTGSSPGDFHEKVPLWTLELRTGIFDILRSRVLDIHRQDAIFLSFLLLQKVGPSWATTPHLASTNKAAAADAAASNKANKGKKEDNSGFVSLLLNSTCIETSVLFSKIIAAADGVGTTDVVSSFVTYDINFVCVCMSGLQLVMSFLLDEKQQHHGKVASIGSPWSWSQFNSTTVLYLIQRINEMVQTVLDFVGAVAASTAHRSGGADEGNKVQGTSAASSAPFPGSTGKEDASGAQSEALASAQFLSLPRWPRRVLFKCVELVGRWMSEEKVAFRKELSRLMPFLLSVYDEETDPLVYLLPSVHEIFVDAEAEGQIGVAAAAPSPWYAVCQKNAVVARTISILVSAAAQAAVAVVEHSPSSPSSPSSSSPSSSSSSSFSYSSSWRRTPGAVAQVHGLVAASVYNDQVCLLERYDSLTGRWEVCLRDSCKMVKIKPIHLAAAPSLASSALMSGQPSSPLPRPAFTLSPDALAESAKMLTWLSAAGAPTALSVLTHLHDLCEVCNYLFVAAAEWADGGGNYLRAYVLQMTALLVLLASWSDERLMQCEVESGPGPAAQGLVSPWTLRRLFCQCVATLSRASVSPETLGDDEWRACVSLLSSCCVVLPSGKVEADMTALHQYLLTRDARGMATFVRYRALLYFVLDDSVEGEGGGGDEVPSRVGGCADIGRSAIVDVVKGHWDELEDRPAAVWEILADFAAHNSVFEQGPRGREAKRKLICDLLKM